MKTCTKCGVEKSLDDFYKHPRTKDGKQSNCKQCMTQAARQIKSTSRTVRPFTNKRCKACGVRKPLAQFDDNLYTTDRHDYVCLSCKGPAPARTPKVDLNSECSLTLLWDCYLGEMRCAQCGRQLPAVIRQELRGKLSPDMSGAVELIESVKRFDFECSGCRRRRGRADRNLHDMEERKQRAASRAIGTWLMRLSEACCD